MSTETLTQPKTQVLPRKFTVDEFLQMYEKSIFAESERVELLEGEVFTMSPIGPLHNGTVIRLIRLLAQLAGDNATLSAQCSMQLNKHSQPEPDFVLLKPRDDDYTTSLPQPHDVLLLIEVSHTSLQYDRQRKLPLYAKAKIPEVWIVDLNKKQVEQFSQPHEDQYTQHAIVPRGKEMVATLLPAVAFNTEQLFR